MAGVNKVILIGNVGKDPEVRAMDNGRKVANFPLATSETFKDRNGEKVERTEWHNIVFWGPVAEVIEKYVKKGSKLFIEGKIRTRSYEQDGIKKYITEIDGQNMTMLDSASRSSDTYSQDRAVPAPTSSIAVEEGDDNDLPF